MSIQVTSPLRLPLATLPRRKTTPAYLVIHCSATPASLDWGAADIDKAHRLRGFHCIGYHYVIKRDGSVEQGRPEEYVGAHVSGHNSTSIGICLVGGVAKSGKDLVPEANYTAAQWDSLEKLTEALHAKYPNAIVQGHCDFPKVAKACPCFDVKAWWKGRE